MALITGKIAAFSVWPAGMQEEFPKIGGFRGPPPSNTLLFMSLSFTLATRLFVFVFVVYFAILPISIQVNDTVNINMIFIYFQRQ